MHRVTLLSSQVASIRWLHKGEIVESSDRCITLTHTITEATSENRGEHVCEVSYNNGTVAQLSAGTLEVISKYIEYVTVEHAYMGYCKSTGYLKFSIKKAKRTDIA